MIGDLPFICSAGLEVFLTPPPLRGVYHTHVVSARALSDGQAIRFEGVDDDAAAFALVGRTCLVPTSSLPDIDTSDDRTSLINCRVWDDKRGDIGIVTALLSSGAQDVLVVIDDNNHETLIPLVDEFVHEMDDADRIVVSLPHGLYELNG
jgi:16S rRNA processing protein RimM